MNELSRLASNSYFTKSQVRLIAKSLQSHEYFQDLFGITGSAQEKIFMKIVKKYTHTNIRCLDSSICYTELTLSVGCDKRVTDKVVWVRIINTCLDIYRRRGEFL